jgi:hypothetical protein
VCCLYVSRSRGVLCRVHNHSKYAIMPGSAGVLLCVSCSARPTVSRLSIHADHGLPTVPLPKSPGPLSSALLSPALLSLFSVVIHARVHVRVPLRRCMPGLGPMPVPLALVPGRAAAAEGGGRRRTCAARGGWRSCTAGR